MEEDEVQKKLRKDEKQKNRRRWMEEERWNQMDGRRRIEEQRWKKKDGDALEECRRSTLKAQKEEEVG